MSDNVAYGYFRRKPVSAAINVVALPALAVAAYMSPVGAGAVAFYAGGKLVQDLIVNSGKYKGQKKEALMFPLCVLLGGPVYSLIHTTEHNLSEARSDAKSNIEKQVGQNRRCVEGKVYKAPYSYERVSRWNWDSYPASDTLKARMHDCHGQLPDIWYTLSYKDRGYDEDARYHASSPYVSPSAPAGYEFARSAEWDPSP